VIGVDHSHHHRNGSHARVPLLLHDHIVTAAAILGLGCGCESSGIGHLAVGDVALICIDATIAAYSGLRTVNPTGLGSVLRGVSCSIRSGRCLRAG
jgi:hypothetical protein